MRTCVLVCAVMCVWLVACQSDSATKAQPAGVQRGVQIRKMINAKKQAFVAARAEFKTNMVNLMDGYRGSVPDPPAEMFEVTTYPTELGPMHAYVSPDPGDGKKHPIVIWRFGGFGNSIGAAAWGEAAPENDQSAAQYRKAGLLMMYPSLRGAHNNPGKFEGFYGEVDDMLAAIKYAKSLDYVDPERVYLGGHSTGGTLALLTAAAAPPELAPRAVFALGPIDWVHNYGADGLPFDVEDKRESYMRAPVKWIDAVDVPTWIIEGEDGNSFAAWALGTASDNPYVRAYTLPGHTHFTPIAGVNEIIARHVLEDTEMDSDFFMHSSAFRTMVESGSDVQVHEWSE